MILAQPHRSEHTYWKMKVSSKDVALGNSALVKGFAPYLKKNGLSALSWDLVSEINPETWTATLFRLTIQENILRVMTTKKKNILKDQNQDPCACLRISLLTLFLH